MNTYQTAKQWTARGISVLPILAHSKVPALDSWKYLQSRLPTERELDRWFNVARYGLAVIMSSDLVVIDWDNAFQYSKWLAGLNGEYSLISSTYQVRTRRGIHYYFRCENVKCWKGEGVDVKAAGGYVLGTPTFHPTGHQYTDITSISAIKRLNAIEDILPEYTIESPKLCKVSKIAIDPFDAAMLDLPETSTTIQAIKEGVRWEQVISGIKKVRGQLKCCCPIHGEKHPSFVIYPDGHAFCFACHWSGDLLDFYGEIHGLTIRESMIELAKFI